MLKLYNELSTWWPLLSPPSDYAEEASVYEQTFLAECRGHAETILELGSGGGNTASFLKKRFRLTLVDRSPGMLEISRTLNPECEHVEGDMRTVRIPRTFDCVFVHDAVTYMASLSDLQLVIETAFEHCRSGGTALFVPDHIKENFKPSTDHGGSDGDKTAMRYLEWTWDPDPADNTFVVDYAFLLRGEDGSVRVEHDRHTGGLFSREDWIRLLSDAGFRTKIVPLVLSDLGPGMCEMFIANKP